MAGKHSRQTGIQAQQGMQAYRYNRPTGIQAQQGMQAIGTVLYLR
jgi:hypothetical protein